jgi:hypothetical protein
MTNTDAEKNLHAISHDLNNSIQKLYIIMGFPSNKSAQESRTKVIDETLERVERLSNLLAMIKVSR